MSSASITSPTSLKNYKPFQQQNMLIYGSTGVGKTIFATSSQQFKTFVFDVDLGIDSAVAQETTRKDLVDFWPSSTKKDFMEGCRWLAPKINQYGLVVVDTSTELSRIVMDDLTGGYDNQAQQTQQLWGKLLNFMETLTRTFRNFPCHVLYVCHEVEQMDPRTGMIMYQPDFQGQFKRHYGKHFSFIARAFIYESQSKDPATNATIYTSTRLLNCQRDANTHAKDRSQALDKYELTDLGIDHVLNKMVAHKSLVNQNG
jgi:hypothetical protein